MYNSISIFLESVIYKNKIKPGIKVLIEKKEDQKSGKTTKGVVKNILTNKKKHTMGIKVRLESGEVGRVKRIL